MMDELEPTIKELKQLVDEQKEIFLKMFGAENDRENKRDEFIPTN